MLFINKGYKIRNGRGASCLPSSLNPLHSRDLDSVFVFLAAVILKSACYGYWNCPRFASRRLAWIYLVWFCCHFFLALWNGHMYVLAFLSDYFLYSPQTFSWSAKAYDPIQSWSRAGKARGSPALSIALATGCWEWRPLSANCWCYWNYCWWILIFHRRFCRGSPCRFWRVGGPT